MEAHYGADHLPGSKKEIAGLVTLSALTGNPTSDPTTPTNGALLVGTASPPGFYLLPLTAPAANVRNVLGADNGDTQPAWKTALDATNPEPIGTATPGTSLIFSHRDHVHASTYGVAPADVTKAAASEGANAAAARADHKHDITTAIAGASAFGDAAAEGTATTTARSDHKHSREADPVTAHAAAGDPHTGYRLESADHTHQSTGAQAGLLDLALVDTTAWTTPSFSAGNFTATTGTWTVEAADVVTYAYRIIGKTMIVAFFIQTSTTASGCTNLKIAIPASKVAQKTGLQMVHINENGTRSVGFVQVNASGTTLDIYRNDLVAFANVTNALLTSGTIVFEIG